MLRTTDQIFAPINLRRKPKSLENQFTNLQQLPWESVIDTVAPWMLALTAIYFLGHYIYFLTRS